MLMEVKKYWMFEITLIQVLPIHCGNLKYEPKIIKNNIDQVDPFSDASHKKLSKIIFKNFHIIVNSMSELYGISTEIKPDT